MLGDASQKLSRSLLLSTIPFPLFRGGRDHRCQSHTLLPGSRGCVQVQVTILTFAISSSYPMPSLIRNRSVSSLVYSSGAPFHRLTQKKFPPLPAYPNLRVLHHPAAPLTPVVSIGVPYPIARITPKSRIAKSRKITHLSNLRHSTDIRTIRRVPYWLSREAVARKIRRWRWANIAIPVSCVCRGRCSHPEKNKHLMFTPQKSESRVNRPAQAPS